MRALSDILQYHSSTEIDSFNVIVQILGSEISNFATALLSSLHYGRIF